MVLALTHNYSYSHKYYYDVSYRGSRIVYKVYIVRRIHHVTQLKSLLFWFYRLFEAVYNVDIVDINFVLCSLAHVYVDYNSRFRFGTLAEQIHGFPYTEIIVFEFKINTYIYIYYTINENTPRYASAFVYDGPHLSKQ